MYPKLQALSDHLLSFLTSYLYNGASLAAEVFLAEFEIRIREPTLPRVGCFMPHARDDDASLTGIKNLTGCLEPFSHKKITAHTPGAHSCQAWRLRYFPRPLPSTLTSTDDCLECLQCTLGRILAGSRETPRKQDSLTSILMGAGEEVWRSWAIVAISKWGGGAGIWAWEGRRACLCVSVCLCVDGNLLVTPWVPASITRQSHIK